MAHFFHAPEMQPSRRRGLRWAGEATELLIVLMVAAVAALWITGAPVHSLLPIHPPA